MSLGRIFAAVCAAALGCMALLTPADSWARGSGPALSQAPPWSNGGAAVTKDGSQMTVVGGNDLDRDIPLVDVASNSKLKKKPPPSFWSRLRHPSQWFSSSKSKK